ncbi:hypothetical protein LSCM1_04454 [Leishmania martiniquensis]|uniref:Uncharacterized protein n=1 Tax=Leishmania martiniquensis TaxID=1580590 RepID=A0A836H247_9TRYP|nr:hypothetical protein LSCM1_04454 [Leishmania martiniquensis]
MGDASALPAREASTLRTTSSPVWHFSGAAFFRAPEQRSIYSRDVATSARPSKDDKESRTSPPQSPLSIPPYRRVTHRSTGRPVTLDKPWLAAPPAHGILKRKGLVGIVSATGPAPPTCGEPTPHGGARAGRGGPSAGPLSAKESIHLSNSSKETRHVAFDESVIKHLDASASRRGYDHRRPGALPGKAKLETAMLSSCAASGFGVGKPPIGTTESLGNANADSWGADSEWFNEEFGAQLTPAAVTADSATATPAPPSAAVTSESAPLSTCAPMRPLKSLPPLSLASLSTSTVMPAATFTAARSTTRQLRMPSRERGEPETRDRQALATPTPSASTRAPHSPRVVKNAYLDSVLSGATPPASNGCVSIDDASSDDGRGLSPVLVYESVSLNTSTRSSSSNVVASSRSSNNVSPALPLSVAALRCRSSPEVPSLATAEALLDGSGASEPNRGSSHPRLSSPSVYLGSLEPSLAEVAGSGQSGVSAGQEATPTPPQTVSLLANSKDLESPTLGAMKLSAGERRLLEAVMLAHERKPLADRDAAPSVMPRSTHTDPSRMIAVETPSRTFSNSAGGDLTSTSVFLSRAARDHERGLRGRTQAQGNPYAQVLPAEARPFLDLRAPSRSSTTPRHSRFSGPAAETGVDSAGSSTQARVAGAQLTSRGISAAPVTAIAATRGIHGNLGSTPIASAETTSGELSPSFSSSAGSALTTAKGSDAQASRKAASAIAAPPALSSETPRGSTLTSCSGSRGVSIPAAMLARRRMDEWDEDEDESEPHIHVPEPTPRIPVGKSSGDAQRRRCGDGR